MFVCMYVCMWVSVHDCMFCVYVVVFCISVYSFVFICMYICTKVHKSICIRMCLFLDKPGWLMCVNVYMEMCTNSKIYVICEYMYIDTYEHIYIYIYMNT